MYRIGNSPSPYIITVKNSGNEKPIMPLRVGNRCPRCRVANTKGARVGGGRDSRESKFDYSG